MIIISPIRANVNDPLRDSGSCSRFQEIDRKGHEGKLVISPAEHNENTENEAKNVLEMVFLLVCVGILTCIPNIYIMWFDVQH